MTKESKSERIRRKLVKAQHQLTLVQEARTAALAKGEAEVAAARSKAAARVIRRTEQVEHWATLVSGLERQLSETQQDARPRAETSPRPATETPARHVEAVESPLPAPDPLHAELSFLESRLAPAREPAVIEESPALAPQPADYPSETLTEVPSD